MVWTFYQWNNVKWILTSFMLKKAITPYLFDQFSKKGLLWFKFKKSQNLLKDLTSYGILGGNLKFCQSFPDLMKLQNNLFEEMRWKSIISYLRIFIWVTKRLSSTICKISTQEREEIRGLACLLHFMYILVIMKMKSLSILKHIMKVLGNIGLSNQVRTQIVVRASRLQSLLKK